MKEYNNYIQFEKLNELDIVNLFTKKPFDFNYQIISKEEIDKQLSELQKDIGYTFIKVINPYQIHSNIVKKVDLNNINDKFEDTDGLITNIKGLALSTRLADCQGILLYDPVKEVIGNIHSGWRGTLNRIIINAINMMIQEYDSRPQDIVVCFCPSIQKCCFEVDDDVKEVFLNSFNDININKYIVEGKIKEGKKKYYIDTVSINEELLLKVGINKDNIYKSGICTKCNNKIYHSYRSKDNGRNIALIAMK